MQRARGRLTGLLLKTLRDYLDKQSRAALCQVFFDAMFVCGTSEPGHAILRFGSLLGCQENGFGHQRCGSKAPAPAISDVVLEPYNASDTQPPVSRVVDVYKNQTETDTKGYIVCLGSVASNMILLPCPSSAVRKHMSTKDSSAFHLVRNQIKSSQF